MSIGSLNTGFDIADIFQKIYGYKPAHIDSLPITTNSDPAAIVQPRLKKTTNPFGQSLYGQEDLLGREVFSPITILAGGNEYKFPYAYIGIERTKIIVETQMTELNGSVKEIISNGDYQITIKGFLIGQYEQLPCDELIAIRRLFEGNEAVRLQSAYSDLFLHENDSIVLTKLSIPEKPRVIGVRDFTLQAVSNNVFSLYVT